MKYHNAVGAALCAGLMALFTTVVPQAQADTPTPDRLAAPPTVPSPTQADTGAQLYWLHCQPCHGDRAQGLTGEWRAQYPPEDQNCWNSGCHGERPYANGWTLPRLVPALLGPGTLTRFATAADLYAFIGVAMPYQAPGTMRPAEYWAVAAFLLRDHGLPDSALPLTDRAAAGQIRLGRLPPPDTGPAGAAAAGLLLALLLGGWWWRWRARR